MRSEWQIRALSDVLEAVIDYRGKTPKKMGGDWTSTGYRVFSAKHIKTGRTVKEAEIRTVSQKVYDKWMQIEVERGDIILTSEAPFGEALHWDSDEKIVLGQRLYGLRADSAVINSKFLYYTVIGHHFQQQLSARSTGTTVRGLRQPELFKCTVPVPSFATQTAIADTLSCLDAKIELNNKINENLEAQAQAVFKSWFVDFEPFQDGEFVESELGLIPEGWRVGLLGEFIELSSGKRPEKKAEIASFETPIPILGASKIMGYTDSVLFDEPILVTGRVGTHGVIQRHDSKCWPSDNTLVTPCVRIVVVGSSVKYS
jgi:type I restriction enzyme S subunit